MSGAGFTLEMNGFMRKYRELECSLYDILCRDVLVQISFLVMLDD